MGVNGYRRSLATHILQNMIFCVQQKKEKHTGLERHEGGYKLQQHFHFWLVLSFKEPFRKN